MIRRSRTLLPVLARPAAAFAALLVALAASLPAQLPPSQKLIASNGRANDWFGHSVAVSGDTAVVGAIRAEAAGYPNGAVYVYVRNGSGWTEQARLGVSDPWQLGYSVAVDGDTVIAGAIRDSEKAPVAGAAYVFVRSGTTWTQQAKLTASDAGANDNLGFSVAVRGDTAIVSAFHEDSGGFRAGAAYVFVRTGTTWTQQAKLTASDAAAYDEFGYFVATTGDDVLVGAPLADGAGAGSGGVYHFARSGSVWSQRAKLTASDAAAGDQFGWSVAMSGDTALVGARLDDDRGGNAGAAYVFQWTGSAWTQQAKLVASDGAPQDTFGWSVALLGDRAIVGAPSGSAYLFERAGASWSQHAKLTANDVVASDVFGYSAAMDGDDVFIGALWDDDAGTDSGSVYVYTLNAPPTAVAGDDQSVRPGDPVVLDGSGSFDDNTTSALLGYSWSFVSRPAGSAAVLADANTAAPSFTADVAGSYVVQLVVQDASGLSSAPDTVVISSDNLAPSADAGDDRLVIVGSIVALDGTASSDPEGDPLSYQWTLASAPAGSQATLSGATTATAQLIPDLEGVYVVALTVSDAVGPSPPDTVQITATSAAAFAEAKIARAAMALSAAAPSQVTTKGNRTALLNFLAQAIVALQADDLAEAASKLTQAIARTDGCAARNAPDGNGPGRDWVTDCSLQSELHIALAEALAAITP